VISSARILCIGKDSGILRTRVAILESAGYRAKSVMYLGADSLLQREAFDLLILSVILTGEEREHITAIVAGGTPVLQVTKTILASELLADVGQLLRQPT
jgi:DNA-binding response OmpR family regulator